MFKSILPQRVLRDLAIDSEILDKMVAKERSIESPDFEYFQDIARKKVEELESWRKTKEGSTWHNTVRYRTRTQLQEEREELEIAVELEKLRN
jgi:hypothetical protein